MVLHTENGMLNMGPAAAGDEVDPDLINAGKIPVTELPGASYFHHADSFAMMRGGHLDVCVLGAFQVSATGDLANWHTGAPDAIPAVGGAMDLAIGAKKVFVMMTLLRQGRHAQAGAASAPTRSPASAASTGSTPTSPSSRSAPTGRRLRRDVRHHRRRAGEPAPRTPHRVAIPVESRMTSSAGSAICAAGSVRVGWLEICSRTSTADRPTSA